MKSAKERAIETAKNHITISDIEKMMENAEKNGDSEIRIFRMVPKQVMIDLIQYGYSVSLAIGPIGEKITVVSWDV